MYMYMYMYMYVRMECVHSLKQKLDDNEKMMFLNLATMVKWADFDLKIRHSTSDDGHVLCGTIRNFESALNVSELEIEIQHHACNVLHFSSLVKLKYVHANKSCSD